MLILFWEDQNAGLTRKELIDFLSKNEPADQVPQYLRKTHGNFGYRYTLSRTFEEVINMLLKNGWVQKIENKKYRLTPAGIEKLQSRVKAAKASHYHIAAYGILSRNELLARFANGF